MHHQVDEMNARNVADGRELTTVSYWFSGESEADRMWRNAKDNEGVAIKSTIHSLSENVHCDPQISQIGQVQYVDLETHSISAYEANQAQERALLKSSTYKHDTPVGFHSTEYR